MEETQVMFPVCAQRNVPQALARFAVPPSGGWRRLLATLVRYQQTLLDGLLR
jgi:hypothetical protein